MERVHTFMFGGKRLRVCLVLDFRRFDVGIHMGRNDFDIRLGHIVIGAMLIREMIEEISREVSDTMDMAGIREELDGIIGRVAYQWHPMEDQPPFGPCAILWKGEDSEMEVTQGWMSEDGSLKVRNADDKTKKPVMWMHFELPESDESHE